MSILESPGPPCLRNTGEARRSGRMGPWRRGPRTDRATRLDSEFRIRARSNGFFRAIRPHTRLWRRTHTSSNRQDACWVHAWGQILRWNGADPRRRLKREQFRSHGYCGEPPSWWLGFRLLCRASGPRAATRAEKSSGGGGTFRYDPLPAVMVLRRRRLRFVYFDGARLRPLSLTEITALVADW